MSDNIAIKVDNLGKCYPIFGAPRDRLKQMLLPRLQRLLKIRTTIYYQEFWALRGVNFDVKRGETLGVLGRNGSGKSTLLQIIAGTLNASEGTCEVSGRLAALLELGSGFNPEFTGRENIYLNGSVLGLSRSFIDDRFDAIAGFADIGPHLDLPVKTYSSGMYVRLAFAVQACIEPSVLIVDEALSVGDEKFQRKCFNYIEGLRDNGCSILLVTHSTSTVEKFCQRAILLDQGILHGYEEAKHIVDHYHALLYSDEATYLRYQSAVNSQISKDQGAQAGKLSMDYDAIEPEASEPEERNAKAIISNVSASHHDGSCAETFRAGDRILLRFTADILQPIKEVQAGVLLRTLEGVSVFGTSTLYHNANVRNVKSGTSIEFIFNITLDLCHGSYFVTIAIAESVSDRDMQYLDRKTDILLVKVVQKRVFGSGIALLKSDVSSRCSLTSS
jgi:lipopolysaccharide transport system ATP-binding protein